MLYIWATTINKDSLVVDDIATFWRGYNMFMGDFGHIKTTVKYTMGSGTSYTRRCCLDVV